MGAKPNLVDFLGVTRNIKQNLRVRVNWTCKDLAKEKLVTTLTFSCLSYVVQSAELPRTRTLTILFWV